MEAKDLKVPPITVSSDTPSRAILPLNLFSEDETYPEIDESSSFVGRMFETWCLKSESAPKENE